MSRKTQIPPPYALHALLTLLDVVALLESNLLFFYPMGTAAIRYTQKQNTAFTSRITFEDAAVNDELACGSINSCPAVDVTGHRREESLNGDSREEHLSGGGRDEKEPNGLAATVNHNIARGDPRLCRCDA